MNCFFCQSPLPPSVQHCIANDYCRIAKVRNIMRDRDMNDNPIEPRHQVVEFYGTLNEKTYLVTYWIARAVDFHFLKNECDVALQIPYEADPKDYYYKDVLKLPYPPISLTPQNFKEKFPILLLLS